MFFKKKKQNCLETYGEETKEKKSFGEGVKETLSNLGDKYKEYKSKAPEREQAKREKLKSRLETEKLKTQIGQQRDIRIKSGMSMQSERLKMMEKRKKTWEGMPSMFGGSSTKLGKSVSFDEVMNPIKFSSKSKKKKSKPTKLVINL